MFQGISSLSQAEQDANVQSRTGPYLENDAANAIRAGDIYSGATPAGGATMVLADMFTKKIVYGHRLAGVRIVDPDVPLVASPRVAAPRESDVPRRAGRPRRSPE